MASLRPQSFVDLGCGNGLLVHILSKEGVGLYAPYCMKQKKIKCSLSVDFV